MTLGDVQDVSFYTKESCSPDVTVQTSLVYQQRLPLFHLEQELLPAKFHMVWFLEAFNLSTNIVSILLGICMVQILNSALRQLFIFSPPSLGIVRLLSFELSQFSLPSCCSATKVNPSGVLIHHLGLHLTRGRASSTLASDLYLPSK